MAAHFLIHLSLLLLLSSVGATRQLGEAPEVAKEGEGEMMLVVEGATIGSRPPSCKGRCSACGHCEAVQVPLVHHLKKQAAPNSSARVSSRGDEYSSNYKPMNWKCKCGDRILNP